MRQLLVCPDCHGDLEWSGTDARCLECAAAFPGESGIAVLIPAASRTAYNEAQATAHDAHRTPEFEIARPAHTPALYGRLMLNKFARGTVGITSVLPDATAVTICGGSGMDAELLARAGCEVIATDISVGACLRAKERAERNGLRILAVAADAEHLPLRDGAVAIAAVHDGLHHLKDPYDGLREMARVAGCAVSVSEPADAGLTRIAVQLGLAESEEDSGNKVGRLDPAAVAAALSDWGFEPNEPHRYGMYYKHHPGRVVRFLSRRRLVRAAEQALNAMNMVGGRYGNKMAVQAVRRRSL